MTEETSMWNSGAITAIITGIFSIVAIIVTAIVSRKSAKKDDCPIELLLTQHPIFVRMESLKNHISMCFQLPNKGKQEVFKDVLKNMIEIYISNLMEYARTVENAGDEFDIYKYSIDQFWKSTHEITGYYLTPNYSRDEQTVLMTVMDKFNNWHLPRLKAYEEIINRICVSQFYTDTRTKASVLLDMYLGMIVDTVMDAESTLNEINGDLKGLVFKGQEI